MKLLNKLRQNKGFTIVELLIVVVVIGILAAITIVSFSGITGQATKAALSSDLDANTRKMQLYYTQYGSYPTSFDASNCPSAPIVDNNYCLKKSSANIIYSYTGTSSTFMLVMKNNSDYYKATESTGPVAYTPPPPDGSYMQVFSNTNCSTSRTRAVDARDNHTYWVQKLGDGQCWMLTNLAYAGGGTNTYSDVRSLSNGGGSAVDSTTARYYIVASTTNFTTEPTSPSTSTDGTGQYGYLYNFCAANGGQASTSACGYISTPVHSTTISICPFGWRLPNGYNEFNALNVAVNGGATSTDVGLKSNWLAQRSGAYYFSAFYDQGTIGNIWSSDLQGAYGGRYMSYQNGNVGLSGSQDKASAYAVRCVAN